LSFAHHQGDGIIRVQTVSFVGRVVGYFTVCLIDFVHEVVAQLPTYSLYDVPSVHSVFRHRHHHHHQQQQQ